MMIFYIQSEKEKKTKIAIKKQLRTPFGTKSLISVTLFTLGIAF
jgi:hypothetical protein